MVKFNKKFMDISEAVEYLNGLEYRIEGLVNHDYDNELPALKAERNALDKYLSKCVR